MTMRDDYSQRGFSDEGAGSSASKMASAFATRCHQQLLRKTSTGQDEMGQNLSSQHASLSIPGAAQSPSPQKPKRQWLRRSRKGQAPSQTRRANVYGHKTWFGWRSHKSAQPDKGDANFLKARENFKMATSTHSKMLVAAGIFLTGVGGVLVAPLAFSTISDFCDTDDQKPGRCRNAKLAATGAVLICVAGIITGISLFVSDQRKIQRAKRYVNFHRQPSDAV